MSMKVKRIVAVTVTAGALLLGTVGPASAGKPVKVGKVASVHPRPLSAPVADCHQGPA